MSLHERLTVVDGLQISNWNRPVLEELRSGGVSAVNATCAVWENAADTLRSVGQWLELANRNPDLVFLAATGEDIDKAKRQNRIAVFLGFQNTSPFEDDYRNVELFHRLGVRIAQLTYNNQNLLGSGCFESSDAGLTRYGRVVVEEMNRVGMLIDLSHVGYRTSREAIEASAVPVSITHSNPLWFYDTPRNKPNEVIQPLVERGGVIGCCLYPTVSGGEGVTLESFCSMVSRMVDLYGPTSIGIGSDCTRGWDQRICRLAPQRPLATHSSRRRPHLATVAKLVQRPPGLPPANGGFVLDRPHRRRHRRCHGWQLEPALHRSHGHHEGTRACLTPPP